MLTKRETRPASFSFYIDCRGEKIAHASFFCTRVYLRVGRCNPTCKGQQGKATPPSTKTQDSVIAATVFGARISSARPGRLLGLWLRQMTNGRILLTYHKIDIPLKAQGGLVVRPIHTDKITKALIDGALSFCAKPADPHRATLCFCRKKSQYKKYEREKKKEKATDKTANAGRRPTHACPRSIDRGTEPGNMSTLFDSASKVACHLSTRHTTRPQGTDYCYR
jgi:hypothetical protein